MTDAISGAQRYFFDFGLQLLRMADAAKASAALKDQVRLSDAQHKQISNMSEMADQFLVQWLSYRTRERLLEACKELSKAQDEIPF